MARKVFFSFHYANDAWRASQVRNMGLLEGNQPVSDNDWETVKKGGNKAIETWIDGQMNGRSCVIVLVGSQTAGRPWIDYEIKRAWELKKGLLGIRIDGLKAQDQTTSTPGTNPFTKFNLGTTNLGSIVNLHNPAGIFSTDKYNSIKNNMESWVETAVAIRNKYQ